MSLCHLKIRIGTVYMLCEIVIGNHGSGAGPAGIFLGLLLIKFNILIYCRSRFFCFF